MMTAELSLVAAFGAGLLSFFSPCVVPLAPAYFSILASLAADTSVGGRRVRRLAVWLAFFSGFAVAFSLLGLTASLVGRWLLRYQAALQQAAGLLFIVLGGALAASRTGLLPNERRWQGFARQHGLPGAFLFGFGFSFGWTPCTGPFLASLLAYASLAQHTSQALLLLGAYALGLAAPFAVLTLLGDAAFFRRPAFLRCLPWLQRLAGVLMVLLGVLLWLDRLNWLAELASF